MDNRERIERLEQDRILPRAELEELLQTYSDGDRLYAASKARAVADAIFGKKVYFRGIVEISSYCKNDCLYCGIRRSNHSAQRYRLTEDEILNCCARGYTLGYRTFVLQGGEDPWYTDDRIVSIIRRIRRDFPDCAITLSLGEKERESYQRYFDAGADRYLLRHETASPSHYAKLHPPELSWEHRMQCLRDLREIGFQTGCGCMVGAPYQTAADLVEDLLFMKEFRPQMIGIGPFIPHKDTPFREESPGTLRDTLFLLSIIRLMLPHVLLPATTALGTIQEGGREQGILAGANVIMPNISPPQVREKYMLYDNKIGVGDDEVSSRDRVARAVESIGYEIVVGRGDYQGGMEDD